ncbi:hypothetical protein CSUI_002993 [Cystoisospora suis]|uniref:Uncharacterized protein n=1 Tax=Cystoisospora suis TaxID=483139 RepID=A0A2C6KRZ2_9APIC|nr:hypothetical protein CSUI_002993 [Cystoisospora suis]
MGNCVRKNRGGRDDCGANKRPPVRGGSSYESAQDMLERKEERLRRVQTAKQDAYRKLQTSRALSLHAEHRRMHIQNTRMKLGLDDPSPDTNFGGLRRETGDSRDEGTFRSTSDLAKGDSGVSSSSSSPPHPLPSTPSTLKSTSTAAKVSRNVSIASTPSTGTPKKKFSVGQPPQAKCSSGVQGKIFKDTSNSPAFECVEEEDENDDRTSLSGPTVPPPREGNPDLAAALADAELKKTEVQIERKKTVRYAFNEPKTTSGKDDEGRFSPSLQAKDSQTTQATASGDASPARVATAG